MKRQGRRNGIWFLRIELNFILNSFNVRILCVICSANGNECIFYMNNSLHFRMHILKIECIPFRSVFVLSICISPFLFCSLLKLAILSHFFFAFEFHFCSLFFCCLLLFVNCCWLCSLFWILNSMCISTIIIIARYSSEKEAMGILCVGSLMCFRFVWAYIHIMH